MKEKISALMDGEMHEDEAAAFCDVLKRHPEARHDWAVYHLIGDVLRQPDHLGRGLGTAFHERLSAEPVVFAPRRRTFRRMQHIALSAVASLMAVALVFWLSLQMDAPSAPQVAAAPQDVVPVAVRQATVQGNDDYLMAHREFSPSAEMQGAASYIHAVAGNR